MLIVKKFGGSSVADKERIFNVASRCLEDYNKGHDVVVVLSAMGKTTDHLLAQAKEINPSASKREVDMLLTTGEQVSVALMCMAFQSLGVQAISLNAWQIGMHTTSVYGSAKLKRIETERLRRELEMRKIVVVTGFQGISKYDDYTTLGRGGSDTTAVALAAVLHADACEIYTDEVTYDEMLDFASLGAKVLHNRSVEMAKKYGVQLVVRSSLTRAEGTIVKEETKKMEKMLVSGVAADKNTARISVLGVKDEPGIAFRVFDYLSAKNINVDIILQSVGRDGTKDISFTVSREDLKDALHIIHNNMDSITAKGVEYEENVAKVSIIGAGMTSNPGVAAKMFEALYSAGINIKMISTSEIRITVLIDEADVNGAMRSVHDAFGLGN